jgi:predicted NAD/FAD-dependent oxidoreductase
LVLAIPHVQADYLLRQSGSPATGFSGLDQMSHAEVAPCWTLMLAYPLANQPGLSHLGPQWNAARSTHHRIAWICRESSKPGRSSVERWTVQASAEWSQQHLEDDAERVQAKLIKAFSELTGIRAEPGFAQTHLWRYAKTLQAVGKKHLWDPELQIGVCGDWLLGHRVEDAFVSGLSLALSLADKN